MYQWHGNPFGDLRRFVCIFANGENKGADAVEPPSGSSLPDCCIEWSEALNIKKKDTQKRVLLFGGLEEIRTPDPHNANVVRSQLRYKPVFITRIL